MGRPPKYATPEDATEANRKKQKIRDEKEANELANDPEKKAEAMKKQVEANARYLAKIPQEIKREKWKTAKQKSRKKTKVLIPSKTGLINKMNQFQTKVSSETAEEL